MHPEIKAALDSDNTVKLWDEAVEAKIAHLSALYPSAHPSELAQRARAQLAKECPNAHAAYLAAYNAVLANHRHLRIG